MKMFLKISLIILLILFFSKNTCFSSSMETEVNILFTHDIHDHIERFTVHRENSVEKLGGYSRLSTAISKEKNSHPNTLVLDAGDFSMGTLYQTIFSSHSPSLRLMGLMGYDATTFGNHEFDFRTEGLKQALLSAKESRDPLPSILSSNILFPTDINGIMDPSLESLKFAFKDYGIKEYEIYNLNNIKVGVFGVMGDDSISNAPMAQVTFSNYIDSAKNTVNKLKKEEVDLIVCLSHSGTWDDKSKSEDEILAKKVPDIDLIISGHSHKTLNSPIIINNSFIVSSGIYGENLGKISLKKDGKRWKLSNYKLIKIDSNFEKDPIIEEEINKYKDRVQEEYLDKFNLKFDQIIAYSDFDFTPFNNFGKTHREDSLANLITDSYIYSTKKAEGENYQPISAAIVPAGVIRDSFSKGNIKVSDVFNISSLGIGPDMISGYPLISVYLTGKELKTTAEVDASIGPILNVAQLYTSRLNYSLNPNRMIFNKITDIKLIDELGNPMEIEDNKLYRVVSGLYSAQMLSLVGKESKGILSIIPKDSFGNEIKNFEDHIIYYKDSELKEWYSLAIYLNSFNKNNKGIPEIPTSYLNEEGRKIIDDDKRIVSRLKSPNSLAKKVYIGAFATMTLLALGAGYLAKNIADKNKKQE